MSSKIIILIFSILPISFILGNFALNVNLILISLVLIFQILKEKNWQIFFDDICKILVVFYIYLIANSIFNYLINKEVGFDGLLRSIGFIKFIFLVISIKILIKNNFILRKILLFWLIVTTIVIFDIFFEKIFGFNLLGFTSKDSTRIISFFYDENVVGGFILAFAFPVCAFFFKEQNKIPPIFLNIYFLSIPISIFLSGERSNFYKSILIFIIFLIFINTSKLIINKKKIILGFLCSIILLMILSPNIFIKQTEFFKRILISKNNSNFYDKFKNIHYMAHFDTAYQIFKDNPINGVGNKNFRIKCSDEKYFNDKIYFSIYRCSTHPHQIHLELLSEQGLIGYFILILIISILISKDYRQSLIEKDLFNIISKSYIIVSILPLLPGGSIFSTFNGSLFWLFVGFANYKFKKN